MWPFSSKEKFSKPKVTPKGEIQLSAPLEYERHVSKAAMEDAEKARVREENKRVIKEFSDEGFGEKMEKLFGIDNLSKSEEFSLLKNLTEEDVARVDAELEANLAEWAKKDWATDLDKKIPDQLRRSNLITISGFSKNILNPKDILSFNKKDIYIDGIWGVVNGKNVYALSKSKLSSRDSFAGALNDVGLSQDAAKKLYFEYLAAARKRTEALLKRAREIQADLVKKELSGTE